MNWKDLKGLNNDPKLTSLIQIHPAFGLEKAQ